MTFIDKDFLLSTPTAQRLYHEAAKDCPIIDYHCHLDPRDIYEDRRFEDITELFLGGDHYKWRLMRCAGVEEKYITGDADAHEKFIRWAQVLERSIGNPLYHWTHLELRNYFGYQGLLGRETAEEVWRLCNERLRDRDMSARGLIRQSRVETICTTDDPIDTLEWHQKLAADPTMEANALPAWRPDRAMGIDTPDYADYLEKLSAASGISIQSWDDLKAALCRRMEYFARNGCSLSDHGLEHIEYSAEASDEKADAILKKRLSGQAVTGREKDIFQAQCMLFLGREYAKRGWVMQLHFGCRRNNNDRVFARLGPNTGHDCIGDQAPIGMLAAYLNALDRENLLPKTILYSLNPNDNPILDSLCGCFQSNEAVCKVQHGAAWWFNDHMQGMIDQMTSLANQGYLSGFVGMLTDSRSFLSYSRHEYFRRILCRLLGQWEKEGFIPDDEKLLGQIVQDISYRNAKKYFQFREKK